MHEEKVKTMLNREVIKQIEDDATRHIISSILFSPSTKIDWERAYSLIMAFMPELQRYDGYSVENMK